MSKKRKSFYALGSIGFLLLFGLEMIGQNNSINSNAKREEIQRYFGYEDVCYRYTTLPYDLSMNTNEKAVFLDIGFLYILFIPLILIFYYTKNNVFRSGIALVFVLYLMSCLYFSKIYVSPPALEFVLSEQLRGNKIGGDLSWDNDILFPIYQKINDMYTPIYNLTSDLPTQSKITYPLLLTLFLGALFWYTKSAKKKSNHRLGVIMICYAISFILFSAGIIWYGFLLFPILLIYMFYKIPEWEGEWIKKAIGLSFYTLVGVFCIMAIVLRISNIQPTVSSAEKGKNLFYPNLFANAVGHVDERGSLNMIFPNLGDAMDELNSTDGLVYRIGTSFNIHINNNHRRVYADNQMAMFYSIYRNFRSDKRMLDILKEYGFEYMLIDLNTPTMDRTPDKTLTRKFQIVMEMLYDNPKVQLINTDRIVQTLDQNGQTVNAYGLWGDPVYLGSYAIIKLL